MGSLKKSFGRVIARTRRQRKMSQEDLAFEIDMTRTHVSLLERGLHSPTLDTMAIIAKALDVRLDHLISMVLKDLAENR